MDENFQIYAEPVLEFIKSAQSFCDLVTHTSAIKRSELAVKLQELLPLLYLNALKLPELKPFFSEGNEKFVTEEEYNTLHHTLFGKLGYLDDYLNVEDHGESDDGIVVCSLSENLADIYQDLRDFLKLYQLGTDEIMNDAIWECRMNFNQYWGRKLLGVLKVLHQVLNTEDPIDDEESEKPPKTGRQDASEWFISRR